MGACTTSTCAIRAVRRRSSMRARVRRVARDPSFLRSENRNSFRLGARAGKVVPLVPQLSSQRISFIDMDLRTISTDSKAFASARWPQTDTESMKITSTTHVAGQKPASLVQNLAKKNESANVAFGAGVRDPAATSEGMPTAQAHPRLEAFAEKIKNRFESALKSESLTDRQRNALTKEFEKFESMLGRFEKAFLNGSESTSRASIQGMEKLLGKFGSNVNHILGSSKDKDMPNPSTPPAIESMIEGLPSVGGVDAVV